MQPGKRFLRIVSVRGCVGDNADVSRAAGGVDGVYGEGGRRLGARPSGSGASSSWTRRLPPKHVCEHNRVAHAPSAWTTAPAAVVCRFRAPSARRPPRGRGGGARRRVGHPPDPGLRVSVRLGRPPRCPSPGKARQHRELAVLGPPRAAAPPRRASQRVGLVRVPLPPPCCQTAGGRGRRRPRAAGAPRVWRPQSVPVSRARAQKWASSSPSSAMACCCAAGAGQND